MKVLGRTIPILLSAEEKIQQHLRRQKELRTMIKEMRLGECATYTRDINALEAKKRHLIFVGDDMMTGGVYHDYITETSLTGRWPGMCGYTEDKFVYLNRRLGKESYPVALPASFASPPKEDWREMKNPDRAAKVWGQVYSIRGSQFKKLDFIRENGVQFQRKRVEVRIPNQRTFQKKPPEVSGEISSYLDCWMYQGIPEYFEPLIDGGLEFSPVKIVTYSAPRKRDWLDEYYLYNPNAKRQDY